MGAASSSSAGLAAAASSGASSGTGALAPPPLPRPTFHVFTSCASGRNGSSAPSPALLRLDDEVLLLLDPETGSQLHQCYYFRIICWGYSRASFHWRAYSSDEGGADATGESEGDAQAPGADAAATSTYIVSTEEGDAIERAVMGAVRALMGRMESRGVGSAAFAALLSCLRSLAEDGLTDHALSVVKQMAVGRKFDARQATELVNTLGALSPFEKMEAACALYPGALLHPASLPTLLLDCFEDATDRENVCHRLGIVVSATGVISEAPTASSRGLKRG